jgi:hypothetical protein
MAQWTHRQGTRLSAALCLAAGALSAHLLGGSFTLEWEHSIEKIRWEEDWRVAQSALVLEEARVRGSGAGMEPPDGAWLDHGVYHYRRQLRVPRLILAHSPHALPYRVCSAGRCRTLAALLPGLPETATVELSACPGE